MPYDAASASRSITIQAITVQLTVSPSQPWRAGQTLTFTVKVYSDSTLLTNRSVKVVIGYQNVGYAEILSGSTGSTGTYTGTWAIPWTITLQPGGQTPTVPCKVWWFSAYDTATNVASPQISGNIAYPTSISISAPSTAQPVQPITISGKLQYESGPDVWAPLANRTVKLYIDGASIANVTTDSSGNYSYTMAAPGPGTYTLKAVYEGEGFTSLAALTIGIGTKPLLIDILPIIMGAALYYTSTYYKRGGRYAV